MNGMSFFASPIRCAKRGTISFGPSEHEPHTPIEGQGHGGGRGGNLILHVSHEKQWL